MTKTKRSPSRRRPAPQANTWRNSDDLYLLKCYDVWSATPPRGCECSDPLPAAA
jgi:hypothetical protein